MFERYTEAARRIVFFGRFEASRRSNGYIEPEHLLLPLCREDRLLKAQLPHRAVEEIGEQRRARYLDKERLPTSADIPMSSDAQWALSNAASEADALGSRTIDTPHLVLGLLGDRESFAAGALLNYGIAYWSYRESLGGRPVTPVDTPGVPEPAEESLKDSVAALDGLFPYRLWCGGTSIAARTSGPDTIALVAIRKDSN